MSAGALLEELRERGVRLQADGLTLRVDAPKEPTPTSCAAPCARTSAPSSAYSSVSARGSKKPTAAGSSSGGARSPAGSPCTTPPPASGTRSRPPSASPRS